MTRFVIRLGYSDFYDFIRKLKEDTVTILDTPAQRFVKGRSERLLHPDEQPLKHLNSIHENLDNTIKQLDLNDFRAAAKLLADSNRPLYLIGCATAEPIVQYFYLLISYLRRNVFLLGGNAAVIAHKTEKINSNAILFSLAFNRYPKLTHALMEYFSKNESEIILLTDRRTSPMLNLANIKLIVHAEGEGMFKTRCSAIAIIEALLFEIADLVPDDVTQRYAEKNKLLTYLDIYTNN